MKYKVTITKHTDGRPESYAIGPVADDGQARRGTFETDVFDDREAALEYLMTVIQRAG